MHSHVLLHGAVRRDGQIVAIDSRSWLVHRREVGAAYRTELARELNQLGFEVLRGTGRGERYFEIAGVPAGLLDRWSSRHHQVQAAILKRLADQETALRAIVAASGLDRHDAAQRLALLKKTAQLAPAEERFMSALTRSAKTPVTHRDLDEHWRATAGSYQLDGPAVDRLRSRERPPLSPDGRLKLLEGLTEFDATFPARDARAVALERSAGVPIAVALEPLRELREIDEILVLADGSGTTREHRGRERATVLVAERLSSQAVQPLVATVVARETERLDSELAERGGKLSAEQRAAIELACGTKPFVVIEGHAGTGKSTTLTGIARAHQATGRQIIVTSTAAVAAERLARELAAADVEVSAHSTVALHKAITSRQIELGGATIIHDEAALASTREQERLLAAVEESGARLIEIGDPRQSHPVGAGGLWPHLEHAARHAGAHVELTRNQRTRDAADRRDQALFRDGQHEHAIRGYAARDRVHITNEQPDAENHALDAAHADRTADKTTIVIAQTSNEHLDELNARAQAIRIQHGQLGREALPVPGRPYALHPGDEIQIRRTIPHADHGQLRNGTTGQITDIGPTAHTVTLQLADGEQVTLDHDQIARADVRLAYVQHPFPAQGQTTDTAHVIVGEHATREGSYVALTRARQQTHMYAATRAEDPTGGDRLRMLSERLSRTEPDLPSIQTPLAHESTIANAFAPTDIDVEQHSGATAQPRKEPSPTAVPNSRDPATAVSATREAHADEPAGAHRRAPTPLEPQPESSPEREPAADCATDEVLGERGGRVWPRTQRHDLTISELTNDQIEGDRNRGWEL